jgi:hypothetical protein
MTKLTNLDFINIAHGIQNTRIYKIKKEFFAYTATATEIIPFISTDVQSVANHIMEILEDSWGHINLSLNYKQGTYNKRKMKKLNALLGECDVDVITIKKWVIFLI